MPRGFICSEGGLRPSMADAAHPSVLPTLGRLLVKTGALRFGTFTFADGRVSSYFIDLKRTASFPGAFRAMAALFAGLVEREVGFRRFDALAALAIAGLTWGTAVALRAQKPLVAVRLEDAGGPQVEGIVPPGGRVLLLDDLVMTGRSLVAGAQALRQRGALVTSAVVLLDRQEGGRERLRANGVRLHALARVHALARTLHEMEQIDDRGRRAMIGSG